MRTLKLISLGTILTACLMALAPAHAIENVRGKTYHLTTKHGPWMVMVTSFRNVRDEEQRSKGLTAEQAAAELVFELRAKGIPAYTFSQDAVKGEIDTRDRLGRDDHRIYAAQRDMICVLAGNYDKIDDNVAKKTLKYIKNFHPKFLADPKESGAIMRADANQRGPLSGAFMTINPMVKPEDVVKKNIDRETRDLNSNLHYALVENPHKYTLRVATFGGTSATPIGTSAYRKEGLFDRELKGRTGFNVVRAGEDAEQLVAFIRNRKFKANSGQFAEAGIFEAYVFHDKFQSIVTIGGFDSPDDPRIRTIAQYYGPQMVPDFRLLPKGISADAQGMEKDEIVNKLPKIMTTHTEQLFRDGDDPTRSAPIQIWSFDPDPQVIAIPRIK